MVTTGGCAPFLRALGVSQILVFVHMATAPFSRLGADGARPPHPTTGNLVHHFAVLSTRRTGSRKKIVFSSVFAAQHGYRLATPAACTYDFAF
eukprot:COSAG01_NODE_59268_length_301_cov_0.767327_1_plen_92_part_01